jgi:hypothetical protein
MCQYNETKLRVYLIILFYNVKRCVYFYCQASYDILSGAEAQTTIMTSTKHVCARAQQGLFYPLVYRPNTFTFDPAPAKRFITKRCRAAYPKLNGPPVKGTLISGTGLQRYKKMSCRPVSKYFCERIFANRTK